MALPVAKTINFELCQMRAVHIPAEPTSENRIRLHCLLSDLKFLDKFYSYDAEQASVPNTSRSRSRNIVIVIHLVVLLY